MDNWSFSVTCRGCGKVTVFPVHATPKAFLASINLIAKLKTVASMNKLVTIEHCQCPPETELVITLPGWYIQTLQTYKQSNGDKHGQ